jgi:hypothetical protein
MMVSNLIVDLLGLAGGIALLATSMWPVGLLVIAYAACGLFTDLFQQQTEVDEHE